MRLQKAVQGDGVLSDDLDGPDADLRAGGRQAPRDGHRHFHLVDHTPLRGDLDAIQVTFDQGPVQTADHVLGLTSATASGQWEDVLRAAG